MQPYNWCHILKTLFVFVSFKTEAAVTAQEVYLQKLVPARGKNWKI